MSFQFACPQGHLLVGDESMAHSQLNCPTCGMLFLVPEPLRPEPTPVPAPVPTPEPVLPEIAPRREDTFAPVTSVGKRKLLHIPCPQGHILETPTEMLGIDVMCPHCGVQFRLNEKDSLESKKKRTRDQELADTTVGNAWFYWAIAIAAFVLIGLIGLIAVSTGG